MSKGTFTTTIGTVYVYAEPHGTLVAGVRGLAAMNTLQRRQYAAALRRLADGIVCLAEDPWLRGDAHEFAEDGSAFKDWGGR